MADVVEVIGANVPAADGNGPVIAANFNYVEKYEQERGKRIGKGIGQYIDPSKSEKLKRLIEDPWIEVGTPINQVVPDAGHRKFFICGAGYGGMLFAVNLIKQGFSPKDMVIVDPAGGFGGTWYWNRYPGLMCDVESYIYLPLLEEMGYMPKQKYASGEEIRLYGESIVKKYGLAPSAMFQSTLKKMKWDAASKQWKIEILQQPKRGQPSTINITADFGYLANGLLNSAKVPDMESADAFKGDSFHTARWNYEVTGGTPSAPDMTKLQDKNVCIIGTGATAIQAVPHLGKWAKHLTIFQRTPSAVDVRGQRDTDPNEWKNEIATGPGWQRERTLNFARFVNNFDEKPAKNMVSDGWTFMPSYSALVGGPSYNVTMENVGEHMAKMHALDYPRSEKVRQRAADIVKDPKTAKSLQAWYPGWCKRPTFHDDYLPTFNRPNVTLVDTDGKSIERITPGGVQFDGKEYPCDVLIWGTGFASPTTGTTAARAGIELTGKNGQTMEEQYENGMSTLHGVTSRGFPNLFWPGPMQVGVTSNFMFVLENLTKHAAYMIAEATKRANGGKPIIEPTAEGEEEWTNRILAGAATFAAMSGCTPSYLNKEGEVDEIQSMEEKMKAAKGSPWSRGIEDYCNEIDKWESAGDLRGLEVTAAA